MLFREEPVTPVYRRWMCERVGCKGELLSTGEGITRLSTRWKHRTLAEWRHGKLQRQVSRRFALTLRFGVLFRNCRPISRYSR
jgi:hypothetical protein